MVFMSMQAVNKFVLQAVSTLESTGGGYTDCGFLQ